jgi:hypothetical protein
MVVGRQYPKPDSLAIDGTDSLAVDLIAVQRRIIRVWAV